MGISTFAITRKEVQNAKTKISLKSPQKNEQKTVNLKLSEKCNKGLTTQSKTEVFAVINEKNSRMSSKITEEDEKKAWKKGLGVKGLKENKMKQDFFKADEEIGKGALFMRTLRLFFFLFFC